MPGHMGHQNTTVSHLKVIAVDKDKSEVINFRAIPGAKNSWVIITKSKKAKHES